MPTTALPTRSATRWISSWIPSSAAIALPLPLLLVTCKLLLCRYMSMRCRYGLSMSEQESTVPEAAPSPLADALAQVGDRWTLLVVQALLPGPRRFNELLEEIPGIAANILSQRLKRLERDALLVSRPYTERPPRAAYELTAEGRELAGALRLLAHWGPAMRCPLKHRGTRPAALHSRRGGIARPATTSLRTNLS